MSIVFPETIEVFPQPVLGKVDQSIAPRQPGRVNALGSIWYARFYDKSYESIMNPGDRVAVVGRQGITLLVMPIHHMLN
jgi:membrane protein implicated in regulation of membrane protease activity